MTNTMNYHIFYRGSEPAFSSTDEALSNLRDGTAFLKPTDFQHATGGIGGGVGGGFGRIVGGVVGTRVCSWLPGNTSENLWLALLGMTGVAMCYTGFRLWRWIDELAAKRRADENERRNRYEYKYLSELDGLLQTTLDDVENPELADVDTIRVGGTVFRLSAFKNFSRNFRKKLLRNTNSAPVVKRVAIPAEDFDWTGTYVDDMVPVGASRDPEEGKKVVMRYDPETESFLWFCDNPSVQYKYLETVARKYVCEFNRVDVFVDIRNELRKNGEEKTSGETETETKTETKTETEKETKTGAEPADKDKTGNDAGASEGDTKKMSMNRKKVYAKFKRYNKKAARAGADATVGGKRVVLKARANRYTYKGKIADYETLAMETVQPKDDSVVIDDAPTSAKENVSWSEWKIGNFGGWN